MRHEVVGPPLQSGAEEASRAGGLSHVQDPSRLARLPSWSPPLAIVVLAIVVRLAVIAADSGYEPRNDAFEYDYMARSIAAGDGYPRSGYLLDGGPTAIRGPGYPYFLAAVYAVSGDSLTAGRVAGALLGALAVWLLYLISRRIWGRRVGLTAAALAALFPPLVLLSRDLLSESLFIALELGAILCVLNFRRSGGALGWALAAGALCGLAALTRNTALVLLLVIPLGLWSSYARPRRRALLAPAVGLASAILVIAPWTIRNAVEFGRFVPLTTSSGITASGVYNETSYAESQTHGAWRDPQIVPGFTHLFVTPGIEEPEVDSALRTAARDFAWQHPAYVAETFGWNLLRMFEIAGGSVVDRGGAVLDQRGIGSADPLSERIGLAIVAVLALLGVIAMTRSRPTDAPSRRIPRGPLFLWLVPVLTILATALVNGLPRDRLPADPFLLILAAIGLSWLWERLTPIESRRLRPA